MNISQLINILNKQINEGDITDKELTRQAELETLNHFRAKKKSDKKEDKEKVNDDEDENSDDKKKDTPRPAAKMNPKQLRIQNQKKNQTQDDTEFEEDDNPLDVFHAQITKNVVPNSKEDEDDEETEETSKTPANKHANIREKPLNLENAMQFEKFVKIVNSFRATESITNDKIVKQYWEKLTLAEKQVIYVFFDNLTKTSDAEKNPNFKMPKSPAQIGIKILPYGQSNGQQKDIKHVSTPQQQKTATKTNIEVKPNANSQNPITPITVGESHKRYISIDALLKEVK